MPTILVVEDDPTLREVAGTYLSAAAFDVLSAADGHQALELDRHNEPDLVILDLMLPRLDGREVFRQLRRRRGDVPVLMVTALGHEEDRILGLQMGADDYLTKPYSPRELVLRVQSLLRRTAAPSLDAQAQPEVLRDGDLSVDLSARIARLHGDVVELTPREFDLLTHFLAHPCVAQSRRDLMKMVWGWVHGDDSTVTVTVRRLREKIEDDPTQPRRLMTVRGVGYRWDSGNLDRTSSREEPE